MPADRTADEHLHAAYDALVTALYLTKQGAWGAQSAGRRRAMRELVDFFIDASHRVDEAEAAIEGRSPRMSAPSVHERRNLLGDVGNDLAAARVAFGEHLRGLAEDLQRRADEIGDGTASALLSDIAVELTARLAQLEAVD